MAVRYALAFTLVLGWATAALGTTYFVRASGDDTADGLSPETAVASIRPAGRLLRNPGDRLVVGPGVYREGNIAPFGNGAPGAPIVLLADVAGALTGDPPGPVVIVPPNTPAATTGFIVYGRHDIVIQGFTVEGAADAGIQVRTRTRTGAHSSAIVLHDNTLRNGRLRGIHVTAVGDVTVADNTVTGNHGAGLRLSGAADGALRPQVSANVIEQNRLGIALERTAGAVVARNTLGANRASAPPRASPAPIRSPFTSRAMSAPGRCASASRAGRCPARSSGATPPAACCAASPAPSLTCSATTRAAFSAFSKRQTPISFWPTTSRAAAPARA